MSNSWIIHTLRAWRLLTLFHQQAGGLGVGGGIGWVIWAYDHPNEGGSTTWEITLQKSGHRESDHMFTSCKSCVSSLFIHFYLELVLCVYVPYWRVRVEGGMWVVPAHHIQAQGRQHITGLRLRDRVHLTLQTCTYTVTWLCCTDLHTNIQNCLYLNTNFKIQEILL